MRYSKEFRYDVCQEYITTGIGRQDICDKYNLNVNTFKVWLLRYFPNETKVFRENKTSVAKKLVNKFNIKNMSKEEMIAELIKKDFEIARLKKVSMAQQYGRHGINWTKQIDFSIVLDLYNAYPVKTICDVMGIKRDGFYKYVKKLTTEMSPQKALRAFRMNLFKEYHEKYKTHGYKWLNAI